YISFGLLFAFFITNYKSFSKKEFNIFGFVFLTFALHNLLAKNGHFFRYENYIVIFTGILIIEFIDFQKLRRDAKVLLVLFFISCAWRGYKATQQTSLAIHNIKNQQVFITDKLNEIK